MCSCYTIKTNERVGYEAVRIDHLRSVVSHNSRNRCTKGFECSGKFIKSAIQAVGGCVLSAGVLIHGRQFFFRSFRKWLEEKGKWCC